MAMALCGLSVAFGEAQEVAVFKLPDSTRPFLFNLTHVLLHGRSVLLAELSQKALDPATNSQTYTGEEAIKKLKEMGLDPPEDMDWKKVTNGARNQLTGAANRSRSIRSLEWGKAVDGLQCNAGTLKPAFTNNEDIVLEFTVLNVSRTNIFLFKGSFEGFVELTIDGQYIRRADYLRDWDIQESKAHFALIEPGKSWTTRINVSKGWLPEKLLKSGKMVVRYFNPKKNGHSIGIAGWSGMLDSNEFALVLH
jgi:hypothetical protein